MQEPRNPVDLASIAETLLSLERRIARLESETGIIPERKPSGSEPEVRKSRAVQSEDIEFEIGFHWFARFGIVALALGMAFLLTFPYEHFPPAAPALLGYGLVAALVAIGYAMRRSYELVSRYLLGGGLVLLYFTTLRMYFFSIQPVLDRHSLPACVPLIAVSIIAASIALRRESVYLLNFALAMCALTVLVVGNDFIVLSGILAIACFSAYLHIRFGRPVFLLSGAVLTFLAFWLWAVNNPIIGNPLQFITTPSWGLFVLHGYLMIFAAGTFLARRNGEPWVTVLTTVVFCSLYYGILALLALSSFQVLFVLHHILAAVLFLTFAVIFWLSERSAYLTFIYAMAGYFALTALILKSIPMPDAFIWLSMQSLLVLSTAIWFRSRFIVVANIFLYFLILFAYVIIVEKVNAIGISFGFVALLSARIMNWQQRRLELKTELMRNAYLTAAFLAFPYMLFRIVPAKYVGLSWMGVAILYYLLNMLIQNQKYRWMGHLTLLLSVLYMLVVGITAMEPVYRIVSFLILGVMLLGASLIFTRQRAKKTTREKNGSVLPPGEQ